MSKTPIIIGIGHYKRVGKDLFARYLNEECYEPGRFSVAKRWFGWKIKDIAHQLYGWAGHEAPEFYNTPRGTELREIELSAIGKSPRQIWEDLGTKAVRHCVYEYTWRDYVMWNLPDVDLLIFPDVRRIDEVEGIKAMGGVLVKIVRPGYAPSVDPIGSALLGYDGWDYVIGGSGERSELLHWAKLFANWLVRGAAKPIQPLPDRENCLAVEAEAQKQEV